MIKEEMLHIEPRKGLGVFKLDSDINSVISELKSRGENYEKVDIVVSDHSLNDPIYIIIPKEGIKLRFDPVYQKLELIEIDSRPKENRYHSMVFKGNVILNNENKNTLITYNYINSIFGPANMPKLIDNNKYLLLRYEGISFLFENNGVESEDSVILGSDAPLIKIAIFGGKMLKESLSNEVLVQKNPCVKIDIDRGILISSNNESEDITIFFEDPLESVLSKLKNPNYIHYKTLNDDYVYFDLKCENEETPSNPDYFLNYFNLGLDIMFDGDKNTVKKIKLYTNNPFSSNFGIYDRCNFSLELNRNFFKKMSENYALLANNNEIINNPISRKISDDSSLYKTIDEGSLDVSNLNDHNKDDLNTKENTISNNTDKKIVPNYNINEKSISLNESFASSLNNSGNFNSFNISPSTNFHEFISKVPNTCYSMYVLTDLKIKSASKFYAFETFNIEVTENNSITSILLYRF